MRLENLVKGFNILSIPNEPEDNKFSLKDLMSFNKPRVDTNTQAMKNMYKQLVLIKNKNATTFNLSSYSTGSKIKYVDKNAILQYIKGKIDSNAEKIIFSQYNNNLDELYQALWYLQRDKEYSFETDVFKDDNKYYYINSVNRDNDKYTIHATEDCNENVINYLKDNNQYDSDTNTDIINNDTYILSGSDCDYSNDKIRTTHTYNKKRKFKFNQHVSDDTETGTFIDVKDIYPPQLDWSNLIDRSFDVKDTDDNTHKLTVKDADNDNNQISFKEDIDYEIDSDTLGTSNDDDNQDDKDDETIDIDKDKISIDKDFNTDELIYVEYLLDDGTKKCYLTDAKDKFLIEEDIQLQGILEIKHKGLLSNKWGLMTNKYFMTMNAYSNITFKQDIINEILAIQLIDPYKEKAIINEYLFNLMHKYYANNDTTTTMKIRKNDNNYVSFNYNINTDTVTHHYPTKTGTFVKIIDPDNNIFIRKYFEEYYIEYSIKDIQVIYKLNGKDYTYKAKDSKDNILFPLIYNIAKDFILLDFVELLYYSLKFLVVTERDTILGYNFNNYIWFNILNKFLKDNGK